MEITKITKSKARQREIISYIANNDVELDDLLDLQKELNQLMNENTIEKQKTYWTKTFDRIVKKKKWADITIREFADLRNAGLTCYAIAEHFKVSKSIVFNYTQRNKKEYYKLFDMDEYQRNKEIWND
ncbi:DUF2481 domain-containing protein [Listeria monocytogenes]|uniref:DUF2481 domain-containing protein n=1 Tax=Listeria monocytogenes TaxID=1639 RepID=A0A475XJG3_LISMN|nr:DUF2481 family protein [Listeria monocytogenes]EAC2622748.1 DUF2481 domain-containing protein [Listeria monocytogenes]EAC3176291.1 DUF2481 domain-containing protein [Listeria monocytogenes]EAC3387066.1 DUF2481 domain-containing protein [Listeria monocytogenes]EAC3659890.1 DUF2481 domain-containing protein [Listeria monocytogenes]EAC4377068.1 DUF2481 domain-containing protein [Listeria monocytogenes]